MAPLVSWADRQLRGTGFAGAKLLAERGGAAESACQLYQTADGFISLNLARPEDQDLLPALFEEDGDTAALAAHRHSYDLLARGRGMGLAIADVFEDRSTARPAVELLFPSRSVNRRASPVVVDLSALWAGPLAGRLLRQAGTEVIKVESSTRPDAMREGDPDFFTALNAGKRQIALDFRAADGLAALKDLLAGADIVIEAARPRALLQLGIDAEALVRTKPGMIWLSITGHGGIGEAANWVGFGDDCAVAGGLSAALFRATGRIGLVGDAIADPLTGILAAKVVREAMAEDIGGRFFLSMSGVVAQAIAEEQGRDAAGFDFSLHNWATRC